MEHCPAALIGTILGKTTESGGQVTHTHYDIGLVLLNRGKIEEALLNYRKAAICGVRNDAPDHGAGA